MMVWWSKGAPVASWALGRAMVVKSQCGMDTVSTVLEQGRVSGARSASEDDDQCSGKDSRRQQQTRGQKLGSTWCWGTWWCWESWVKKEELWRCSGEN
jgi:hypothetical protein